MDISHRDTLPQEEINMPEHESVNKTTELDKQAAG